MSELVARLAALQNGIHPVVIVVLLRDVGRIRVERHIPFEQHDRLALSIILEDRSVLPDPASGRRRKLFDFLGQLDLAAVRLNAAVVPRETPRPRAETPPSQIPLSEKIRRDWSTVKDAARRGSEEWREGWDRVKGVFGY